MATVNYEFADGHFEDVECTEDFKREYEFLLVREKVQHWKEMKQKTRAGLKCSKDWSLNKYCDDGFDVQSAVPDPQEEIIQKEERAEYYKRLFALFTKKQREVYNLKLQGLSQTEIAGKLGLAISSVNERLKAARKRIFENFLKNPKI